MLSPGRGWSWFFGTRPLALAAALGLVAVAGCLDGASGPDGTGAGHIALRPALPADVQNGQFSLGIDAVGLRLQRPGGDVVVDTVFAFHPDSASVHAAIRVAMLRRVEEFHARLTLQDGQLVLFSGSKLILLQQGPPGTNEVDSVPVSYEGPGRDIASIAIQPGDTVLPFGQSLPLRVLALDSAGSAVTQFFVSWSVSDTMPGRLNAFGILQAPEQRGVVTVSARTPNGASASGHITFIPGPPYESVVLGGDTVNAPVGSAVSLAVRVIATDSLGVPGVPVRFSASTPGGFVTDSVVVSDSSGMAVTQVVVGETLRSYGYEIRVGTQSPSQFTVAATAGPPALLRIAGGNGQAAPVNTELVEPIVVNLRDAHGNPVRGQRVNFVVTSGGGAVWAGSNNTNDSGVAMERWTLGTTAGVAQRLEARAVDNVTGAPLLFAVFNATALPGPATSLLVLGGDGQAGTVGTALAESLVVWVTDQYGNPVPDVAVGWSAEQGGISPASAAADAGGMVRAAWVLGSVAGTQGVTATAGALVPVAFTATAAAGPPAAIETLGGVGQSATAGAGLPESLAVRVTDAFGNPAVGITVDWSTEDGGVVTGAPPTTDADGMARAAWRLGTAAGPQLARAVVGALAADFEALAVAGPPATVTVSAPETLLSAIGSTVNLGASISDEFGNPVVAADIVWSSSNTSVAVVDGAGMVTAQGNGTARITASVAGFAAGFVDLTVAQAIATVDVTPEQTTLNAVGASVQLEIAILDPNGHPVGDASVAWASSDTDVATVSPNGLVSAVGPGEVTVTATVSGDVVQTVTLTVGVSIAVTPTVAQVRLTPTPVTLSALGASVALTGHAADGAGNDVPGAVLSWASSNDAVATVSASGVVTAVGNGTAIITASSGGVSGTATVTVAQQAAVVAVSPEATTLTALGATAPLAATVRDAGGSVMVGAAIAWASSNAAVATVSGAGVVTAVGNGTATITASSDGVSGAATIVVSQVAAGVAVTPATVWLTALGVTAQLGATVQDANGEGMPGAAVTWTSSDPDVATVSATGLVTAVGNGTAIITATSGGVSGTATVTVAQQAAVVAVSPEATTLTALGATAPLAATVRDAGGSVMVGAAIAWASSNTDVATVSAAGVVTAVGNGTATITATSGGVSGTATVTVAIPPSTLTVLIMAGQGNNKAINLGSQGNTPVAILTTSTGDGESVTFDAATVNVSTVRFEAAAPVNFSLEDVDGDGDTDLRLHFTTADLQLTPGSAAVTLTGLTMEGTAFEGHETVVVLAASPSKGPRPRS
ncbi:MAG TPA: Ig-like domain-containing protein [Gemmatimonadales bacterium]|nr:Ig-like domain-containing protein [Gemmatimonadales bacterium]